MKTFPLKITTLFLFGILLMTIFKYQPIYGQVSNWQETVAHNPCPGDSLGSIEISFTWSGGPDIYFTWSNGATVQNLDFLPSGMYCLTVTDSLNPAYLDTFVVEVLNTLLVTDSVVDASVLGASDGEIYLIVVGGSGQYNFDWATGDSTFSIANLYAGSYPVTISDGFGCNAEETFYVESPIPIAWEVTPSNTTHTLFLETTSCVEIADSTLTSGSLIGVFLSDDPQASCLGHCHWNMQYATLTVFIPDSVANQSSSNYQPFVYKVLEATTANEYTAYPCGSNCEGYASWYSSGTIECIYVENSYNQTLTFPQGWGTFSVALDPDPANMETVFAPIINEVKIIKDGFGLVYWPEFNVNFIGDIEIGMGYQIKTFSAQSLTVHGYHIQPELIPFTPPVGWSMFGYYSNTPIDPAVFFNVVPYVQNAVELVKSGYGNVYWPFYGLNTIWDLEAGQGYWVFMNYSSTYTLPAHGCN